MKNGQAYFCISNSGRLLFNIDYLNIPACVYFWVCSCKDIFPCEAFRFLRFDYNDYTVEVRNTLFGRYPYKLLWKSKK